MRLLRNVEAVTLSRDGARLGPLGDLMRGSAKAEDDLVLIGSRELHHILKRKLKIQSECANYFSTNHMNLLNRATNRRPPAQPSLQPLTASRIGLRFNLYVCLRILAVM